MAKAVEQKLGRERKCNSPHCILARMLKLNIWLITKRVSTVLYSLQPCWNTGICCWRREWLSLYDLIATRSKTAWKWPTWVLDSSCSKASLPLQQTQRLVYTVLHSDQGMSSCFIQHKESRSCVIALLSSLLLSDIWRFMCLGRAEWGEYLLSSLSLFDVGRFVLVSMCEGHRSCSVLGVDHTQVAQRLGSFRR